MCDCNKCSDCDQPPKEEKKEEDKKDDYSEEEEKAVKERLRGLGYLD